MEWYYILMITPALIVTLYGYHRQRNISKCSFEAISTKELLISFGVNIVIALFAVGIMQSFKYSKVSDYSILNGEVTKKYRDTVSCEHSYQVCSGSGKNVTCTTHYEHSEDYDWVVKTTVGNLEIKRVDSQGYKMPDRFNKVVIGEPAALSYQYSNYLLADKESLFLQNAKGGVGIKKANTYDYYRTKHVLGDYYLPDLELQLQHLLKGKNFNLTIVTVFNKPIETFYDVMKDWNGGKINEITLVVGLGKDKNITWVKGNSYAKGYKNQLLLKEIEDVIQREGLSKESLKNVVDKISKGFILHKESEFEEKLDLIEIPLWLVILLTIVNFVASIFVHKKMKETRI